MNDTLTEVEVRDAYGYEEPQEKTLRVKVKDSLKCDANCAKNFCLDFFPIIKCLRNYSFRSDLPGDIIGGVTTAIVRIPQSLAYGLLAGVQPINGMYTAFFSPLFYSILGTSKHISVGTFAVISLMLGSALEKFILLHPFVPLNSTQAIEPNLLGTSTAMMITSPTVESDEMALQEAAYKLAIVASLTMLAGVIQILLGVFKLGFVAMFLSDPLISGFTTSSAIYVFTAQVKYFFGIRLERQSGPFSIIKTYVELFKKIDQTNVAEVVISLITIALLYPIKLINVKYKKQLRNIPIPMELIIVIIATITSAYVDFHELYGVEIVGHVPSGLPTPMIPNPALWLDLLSDAFSVSVVCFAITVSIGKLFAKKHGYSISPNQELFALGASQIACGFFQGHACSGSLARSSVKESSGTKTQVADFVSCLVMLIVLLYVGPLLRPLPVSCLSSIIMVNIRTLFHQFLLLPEYYRRCKYDFCIWLVTFTSVFLLGVDIGLFIGVVFLLITIVIRKRNPKAAVSGQLGFSNIFRGVDSYTKAVELSGIKILLFPDSPFFANKEKFESLCFDVIAAKKKCNERQALIAIERTPTREPEQRRSLLIAESSECELPENDMSSDTEWLKSRGAKKTTSLNDFVVVLDSSSGTAQCSSKTSTTSRSLGGSNRSESPSLRDFHTVIFDCSSWTFIDTMGMDMVKMICIEFNALDLRVCLAALQPDVFNKLDITGLFGDDIGAVAYPSVEYAIQAVRKKGVESDSPSSHD